MCAVPCVPCVLLLLLLLLVSRVLVHAVLARAAACLGCVSAAAALQPCTNPSLMFPCILTIAFSCACASCDCWRPVLLGRRGCIECTLATALMVIRAVYVAAIVFHEILVPEVQLWLHWCLFSWALCASVACG